MKIRRNAKVVLCDNKLLKSIIDEAFEELDRLSDRNLNGKELEDEIKRSDKLNKKINKTIRSVL